MRNPKNILIQFNNDFNNIEVNWKNNYLKVNFKDFVRGELNIPASDKLKKNGTFERGLYYKVDNCLKYLRVKIQTMLWTTSLGKNFYISIFPSCLIKYNKVSTDMIEFISSNVRKDEYILDYIDDADCLIDCEDILSRSCERVNKACNDNKYAALLNSRYTEIFNAPISIKFPDISILNTVLFKDIIILLMTSYACFENGILKGDSLSAINEFFKFL